jgi:glycosyltransferase involved in cell wall biosynthesis
MKITAIIAVRNEAAYIGRCCEYLAQQHISFVVIDNESTDDTRSIAESFRGRGLIDVVSHVYPGFYDWTALLTHKEKLARELESEWFLHLDADEIPEGPRRGEKLTETLSAVDAAGFTSVNFDEFVFVPTTFAENHEGRDYVQTMHNYFFFEPRPQRLVRAWRKATDIRLANSGGHAAEFIDRRIWPENFVLRHYIALSMKHLGKKYQNQRAYSAEEVARGWHGWRARFEESSLKLPEVSQLWDVRTDGQWNRTIPFKKHAFLR